MGLIVFGAMVAGWAVGLAITALLASAGIGFTIKLTKNRNRVWWFFAVTFAIVLPLLVTALEMVPYEQARPGSDYNVAMKNVFLKGLGYCATPGIAALCAGFVALLSPRKT